MTMTTTTTRGLFATMEAAPGKEDELEQLLITARSIVEAEPKTTSWFALRMGRGEYGIFDAFPDDAGRDAHLNGGVVAALRDHADLFEEQPEIEEVDVLADKRSSGEVTKGLLLRLPIEESHRDDAAEFLRNGESVVEQEPGTTNWFAIRFENGNHGVFDVFPDAKGRRAHLTGKIPQQLAAHGLPWLDGLPQMSFADVIADKVGTS
jgi:quinol monooxygenase YgiN